MQLGARVRHVTVDGVRAEEQSLGDLAVVEAARNEPQHVEFARREIARLVRDRAILLLGFAAALRRSELSALDVADVVETAEGLRIVVGRSKTDQEGEGRTVGITYGANPPTCPVRAWRAWVQRSGIKDGPAFRRLSHGRLMPERISGDGISRMVKRRAKAAGYAPELFSGHSLRSGFATTAARAGVAEHRIMRQGRWTTSQAMRGYIQQGELFVDNPSAKLGL